MHPKSRIARLILLARADHELSPAEVMLIYGMAQHFELDKDEMDELIAAPERFAGDLDLEQSERVQVFVENLLFALVDGELNPDEEELLKKLGERMGFEEQRVNQLLDRAALHSGRKINAELVKELLGQ